MSSQHYNAIRQSIRSKRSGYVVSSFLVMMTIALHRVIRLNGHISKTIEPIFKIFVATDSATMVSA